MEEQKKAKAYTSNKKTHIWLLGYNELLLLRPDGHPYQCFNSNGKDQNAKSSCAYRDP